MFGQVEQVGVVGLQWWWTALEAGAEYQQAGSEQQGQHCGEGQTAGDGAGQLGPPLGRGGAKAEARRHQVDVDAEHHGHQPKDCGDGRQ